MLSWMDQPKKKHEARKECKEVYISELDEEEKASNPLTLSCILTRSQQRLDVPHPHPHHLPTPSRHRPDRLRPGVSFGVGTAHWARQPACKVDLFEASTHPSRSHCESSRCRGVAGKPKKFSSSLAKVSRVWVPGTLFSRHRFLCFCSAALAGLSSGRSVNLEIGASNHRPNVARKDSCCAAVNSGRLFVVRRTNLRSLDCHNSVP